MKVTRFTDTMIRNLKPADKKYIRGEGNGFTLRVMPSGVKTWLYVYAIDGKRREMNLGTYPLVPLEAARNKFDAARARVKNGFDPVEEREQATTARRNAHTVADLVSEYLERHAKRFKRSWEEDERILNKEVAPLWGKRKAGDIVKRDVISLLETIVDRGSPAMANNTFQIVRKMFNYAVEKDILPYTPCGGIKLPSPKIAKDRTLNEGEIKTLWERLDHAAISDETRRIIKLILVTAQRPGEVAGMHTSEIDGHWWTISADRAKNGKTHRVYLTSLALELIGGLKVIDKETGEEKDKGFIFPCPHHAKKVGIDPHALAIAVSRNLAWPLRDKNGKALCTKDGKPATENKLGVDKFTPHDLRRTTATFMAKAGELDEVIDAVLNHAKQGVIKVYNQYRYDKEKQQALEAWERKLNSIVSSSKTGNVIPIKRRA